MEQIIAQTIEQIYDDKIHLYEGINEYLLPYIPNYSRVLDVGCSTGMMGALLKNTKECKVYGIDISRHAVKIAESRIDYAIPFDIENMQFPFEDQRFDVIVFGDVLEHLKQPEDVLKLYSQYLTAGGVLVVSIPNVANLIIRLKLLLGKWDYSKNGIMDSTHLRFFTLRTMQKMFDNTNLYVRQSSYIPGRYLLRWRDVWLVKKLELVLNRLRPTLFATQFVFQLGKNR